MPVVKNKRNKTGVLPNAYLWMSRYGPLALCVFGLAMVLYAMIVERPAPITITWIVMGAGAFFAGIVLPRVKGAVEVGTQGVKAELDDVRAIEARFVEAMTSVVTATAEKVAEATIPEQPDKDAQIAEQVKVVRDTVAVAEHNLPRLLVASRWRADQSAQPGDPGDRLWQDLKLLNEHLSIPRNADPELAKTYSDFIWSVLRNQARQPESPRDETAEESSEKETRD